MADDEEFGPVKKRSCTDIICTFLFLSCLSGWGFIGYWAYTIGDPNRLVYPTDSLGQICGIDPKVRDKKYLFFFNVLKCANPLVLYKGCDTPQICVDACPNESFTAYPYFVTNSEEARSKLICKYEYPMNLSFKELVQKDYCAPWYVKSKSFAKRCVPDIFSEHVFGVPDPGNNTFVDIAGHNISMTEVANATEMASSIPLFESVGNYVLKGVQDIVVSWKVILGCFCMALFISLLWVLLIRFLACPMVWISLLLVLALLSLGVLYSYYRYDILTSAENKSTEQEDEFQYYDPSSYWESSTTWLVLLIVSGVVLIIYALILIFLRRRIQMAIALIQEASHAISDVRSALIFPIIPWALFLCFLAYGVIVAVYLLTSGKSIYTVKVTNDTMPCGCQNYTAGSVCDLRLFQAECGSTCPSKECSFFRYKKEPLVQYAHLFNIFNILWALAFVSGFQQLVLAGAFAMWYWTFDKSHFFGCVMARSIYRAVRYHIGTIAFGSLLLAICRFVRMLLEFVDQKLKKYNNGFVRSILCCMKCCLYFLEKFLKFISKNAYIMCAIYGSNFCNSSREAFNLLLRNAVRIFVLTRTTFFLLLLGKLIVLSSVGVSAYLLFSHQAGGLNKYVPRVNYVWVPIVVILLLTYSVANIFFGVFEMAVNTLFLCFLDDLEVNDGSEERPYFMSYRLMKLLSKRRKYRARNRLR